MGTENQAGNEVVGYEQARGLRATMVAAGIDRGRLWLYYFSIGGQVSEFELDAYLHHSLILPPLQRDLLAQAANEILADLAPPQAPYACDVHPEHPGHPDRSCPVGGPAPTDQDAPAQDAGVMDHEISED